MNLMELGSLIKKEAPLLGAIIGSANPIAGILVNLIAACFGTSSSNLDGIADKINNDADARVKLKQIEVEHQDVLINASVSDRANAREREETYIKMGKRDYILDGLAIILVIGFFVMCILVSKENITQSQNNILYMLIGNLAAGFITVIGYYFGSSNK